MQAQLFNKLGEKHTAEHLQKMCSLLSPSTQLQRMLLLSLLFCLDNVSGFFPNHESGGIDPAVFTDADITTAGVLQAVARYMERNPLPGKTPVAPGELENMKPLDATRLFKAFYKGKLRRHGCEDFSLPDATRSFAED